MTGETGLFKRSRFLGINGALILAIWLATAVASPAQIFNSLVSFDGANGAGPEYMSLVQGRDGNYYGTTLGGGANGVGTVFRMTAKGNLTTLYSFCAQPNCTDGSQPHEGLALGENGDLYGTTVYGGAYGAGTVFRITPAGALTTLYSFCAQSGCPDGEDPNAGLVQASSGSFYGTTTYGGAYGGGTVFKITPAGALTSLHSFDGTDGMEPAGMLIQATNGNLYGTTPYGGNSTCSQYPICGTLFEITPAGRLTTLYTFCTQTNCPDGTGPFGGLVQASNGDFYGTTAFGGLIEPCESAGCGTLFKLTPTGTVTTLYTFCTQSNCSDGAHPYSTLVQATDGSLYGTTNAGGSAAVFGTIFNITPGGKLTTLHTFSGIDGGGPFGALLQATAGTFYGATDFYGAYGDGTIFSLDMGLGPFVAFVRSVGKVGANVQILGQGFTGTTAVSFNGTPATFTVLRDTFLAATVPAGASTGPVTVTTPSGTLTSNAPFRVRH